MRKKILIIDDEHDVMTYLVAVLDSNNYDPYSADSVESGFLMLEEVKPDLICLDIMMPKESGISMYIRLKNDPTYKDIPVIIISGVKQENEFDFSSYVPDKTIPAPDYFMEKPIDVEEYIRTIGKLISSATSSKKRGNK